MTLKRERNKEWERKKDNELLGEEKTKKKWGKEKKN